MTQLFVSAKRVFRDLSESNSKLRVKKLKVNTLLNYIGVLPILCVDLSVHKLVKYNPNQNCPNTRLAVEEIH